MDLMSRVLSPYDINPMGANPLREILAETIDFDVSRSRRSSSSSPRPMCAPAADEFSERRNHARRSAASACLPTMFRAVEIDGEAYWDGGYSGNPTITPLVRESDAHDTILVQINPANGRKRRARASEILNRLNEISFNFAADERTAHDRAAAPGRRSGQGRRRALGANAHAQDHDRAWPNSARRRSSMPNGIFIDMLRRGKDARRERFLDGACETSESAPPLDLDVLLRESEMGLLGILIALGLLIWLAYRGWSILLLAPLPRSSPPLLAGEPLLANWTQTFMGNAAHFVAQFFPIFLLGALFGKLMEDSGSVRPIAEYMTERWAKRARCWRSCSRALSSPTAASACSSPSSCWRRWRKHCSARRPFRIG